MIIPHLEPQGEFVAEEIPLDLVYQDLHILVINKPPDLVVHPAAGNWEGTLLNAYAGAMEGPLAAAFRSLNQNANDTLNRLRVLLSAHADVDVNRVRDEAEVGELRTRLEERHGNRAEEQQ